MFTQALTDLLAHAAEENRQRVLKLRLVGVRLQCLRCRSEFTGRSKKERVEDDEEQQEEEPGVPEVNLSLRLFGDREAETQRDDGEKGDKWIYEVGHNTKKLNACLNIVLINADLQWGVFEPFHFLSNVI